MSTDPNAYPTIIQAPSSRLWALFWAAVFFVVINIVVLSLYGREEPFTRFHYHTSYEEVREMIGRIRQDPRRKIIFIGGSVMWGANSIEIKDTIPSAFADLLNREDVAVYNLGIVGIRPIDEFLLMYLLQHDADLFIADFNYSFGLPIDPDLLLQEKRTSIRMSQLFAIEGPQFLRDVPDIGNCLSAAGLTQPRGTTKAEGVIRGMLEHAIPVLRYKDRINDRLFGQHPLLLVRRAFLLASKTARQGNWSLHTIASLFLPPEEIINTATWQPDANFNKNALSIKSFDPKNVHLCASRAWNAYALTHHVPVITYVTPNNPRAFPGLAESSIHTDNIAMLTEVFRGSAFLNLDDQPMDPELFAGSTHLTPNGVHIFTHELFRRILPILTAHAF